MGSTGWTEKRIKRRVVSVSVILTFVVLLVYWTVPSSPSIEAYYQGLKESFESSEEYYSKAWSAIDNGEVFNVDPSAVWRKPMVYQDRLKMPQPVPTPRCKIYTFNTNREEEPIVEVWKRAWWAQGFEPIVLTREDCKQHPQYEKFTNDTRFDEDYRYRFEKFFAWASKGAGVLMNHRIIPINLDDEDTLGQLQTCSFDYPYRYLLTDKKTDEDSLQFVHSGPTKAKDLIDTILEGPKRDWDLDTKEQDKEYKRFLADEFDKQEQDLVAWYNPRNVETMFDGQKKTPQQVSEIMNAHLHHAFLKRYPQGVMVADWYEGQFSSEAFDIGKRLQSCPKGWDLEHSCPPTRGILAFVEDVKKDHVDILPSPKEVCHHPCSDSAQAKWVPSEQTHPGFASGHYTIVSVPHPLTYMAYTIQDSKITAEKAKYAQDLEVDEFVNILTERIVPHGTSLERRLLLVKDAMFQSSLVTNTTWILWERDSFKDLSQAMEYEVGFKFPQNTEEVRVADAVVNKVRTRVLNDQQDAGIQELEKYSPGDAEIWHFLDDCKFQRESLLNSFVSPNTD